MQPGMQGNGWASCGSGRRTGGDGPSQRNLPSLAARAPECKTSLQASSCSHQPMRGGHMRPTASCVLVVVACLAASRPNQAANDRFSDWGSPLNLGSIVNSPFIDQTPEISKDGLSLYFSSMRP